MKAAHALRRNPIRLLKTSRQGAFLRLVSEQKLSPEQAADQARLIPKEMARKAKIIHWAK